MEYCFHFIHMQMHFRKVVEEYLLKVVNIPRRK